MLSARTFTLALASAVLAAAAPASAADQPAYTKTASIPGPDGFWDITAWDPANKLVYVAHGTDVLVVDPAAHSVKAIGAFERAHSALPIPGTANILVTSGGDNSVHIIDRLTGQEQARIAVGANPDAAVVTPDGAHAYAMNAKDGTVSMIDLKSGKETGRVALKPGLEFAALLGPNELAVNDEDLSDLFLVNLATGKTEATIPLTGCKGPTGLAYAPELHMTLSVCGNGKAALVDLKTRKVARLVGIGQGPDTAIWDAKRHRFIVPCGRSGTLVTIAFAKPGSAPVVSQSPSEPGARTGALDPATGRVFLPTARFGEFQPGQRPPLVAGSFHVVVMSPAS